MSPTLWPWTASIVSPASWGKPGPLCWLSTNFKWLNGVIFTDGGWYSSTLKFPAENGWWWWWIMLVLHAWLLSNSDTVTSADAPVRPLFKPLLSLFFYTYCFCLQLLPNSSIGRAMGCFSICCLSRLYYFSSAKAFIVLISFTSSSWMNWHFSP